MSSTSTSHSTSNFADNAGAATMGRFEPTTPRSTSWHGSALASRHPQPSTTPVANAIYREREERRQIATQHSVYRDAVLEHAKQVRSHHARMHSHSDSTRIFEVVAITGLVTMAASALLIAIVMLP